MKEEERLLVAVNEYYSELEQLSQTSESDEWCIALFENQLKETPIEEKNTYAFYESWLLFFKMGPFNRVLERIVKRKQALGFLSEFLPDYDQELLFKTSLMTNIDEETKKEVAEQYLCESIREQVEQPEIDEYVSLIMSVHDFLFCPDTEESIKKFLEHIKIWFINTVKCYNYLKDEFNMLKKRETAILEPLLNDPLIEKYIGMYCSDSVNRFELSDEDFDFTADLASKNSIGILKDIYRKPASIKEIIDFWAENGYIDNDIVTKEKVAYRLFGRKKPKNILNGKITWYKEPNPLCYCIKEMIGKHGEFKRMHLYFEFAEVKNGKVDNPSDKANYCKEFKDMIEYMFKK